MINFAIILFISLWSIGWRVVTDEGQLLNFIRKFFEVKRPGLTWFYLGKAIVLCVTCYASFWGLQIYSLCTSEFDIHWSTWWALIDCVSAAGLNSLIWLIIQRLRGINS